MSTYDRIYEIVRQIPWGQVATYGQIAELANLAGKARLIGYALYRVDLEKSEVPWHRVINAQGQVSHSPLRQGTDYWQRSLLEQEGIIFDHQDKLNLRHYRWRPTPEQIQQFMSWVQTPFSDQLPDQLSAQPEEDSEN